ncbi:hypothetical protein LCGC14_1963000 [marine sediment metagenome]|uniref:Uncharacterized protein n=1 Tax=marine sediment metagenome TaxID=412755 RepID=A0A0F9IB49_9ZZZZ
MNSLNVNLDPYFEEFFTESLLSFFDKIKEGIIQKREDSSMIKLIEKKFLIYTNCNDIQYASVIDCKEQFLAVEENKGLFNAVKESIILPIFYNNFESTRDFDYLKIINDIIASAINLFFKLAMDFVKNPEELFLRKE